jgi:hypothetical protein
MSINIATLKSYQWVQKYWYGGRIISEYYLDENNICFFYLGSKGDPLISKAFKEKPVIIKNECLNYIYSDKEIEDIYKEMKNINNLQGSQNDLISDTLIEFCSKLFKKTFEPNWSIEFSAIENCDYCTDQISPNPILHLVQVHTKPEVFSKNYYKKFLEFLLKKGFLATWLHVGDIDSADIHRKVLDECRRLSANEVYNNTEIDNKIQTIVSELFDKYEMFEIIYLASQCGSQNSIIHILFENMYNILPKDKKTNVEQSTFRFQPIFKIKIIELHFIQATDSREQLRNLYETLKTISRAVRFYDFPQHKVLFDEYSILKSINQYEPKARYRFICDVEVFPAIDYLQLQNKVYEIGNAIKEILHLETDSRILNEMWVKKINMEIFTPTQFEDDVIYALSRNWFTIRNLNEDYMDEETKSKVIFVNLACDYQVFKDNKFIFPFNYIKEIQYTYTTLNERLALKHNFTHFSVEFNRKSLSQNSKLDS